MRILVIADNAMSAEAIRRELRHTASCEVIGFVDGRRTCSPELTLAAPDVILIDDMPNADQVLARIREIRSTTCSATVVLLSTRMEPDWLACATAAGIHAAIDKSLQPAMLGPLVRELAEGRVYHAFPAAPAPAARVLREIRLTSRELEILRLVAGGHSNSRIAARLWVTEQTVKFHLSNTYRKLGVANRTEASHFAHIHRLLDDSSVPPSHTDREAA